METDKQLREMILEFSYLVHRTRQVGLLGIKRAELKEWFGPNCSEALTRYVIKGMGSVRQGRVYERTVAYLRAQMPEEIRDSEVSAADLKAMEYAVQLFEFCVSGSLEDYVGYARSVLDDEYGEQETLQVKQVLDRIWQTDRKSIPVDRLMFEEWKRKEYEAPQIKEGEVLTEAEIRALLRQPECDFMDDWD